MDAKKSEVPQGTLDLMILETLLKEGTVYTSLLRLQQHGWIAPEWGTSENNGKAKFYPITKSVPKQLALETENWERISGVIRRVPRIAECG